MKSIYINSSITEKEAKKRFCFPENIMMENAAAALESEVLAKNPEFVLILCGSGNNGGDGYALSRRIFGKVQNVLVISFGNPKTEEAILQQKMAFAVGVKIIKAEDFFAKNCELQNVSKSSFVIVDCVYGTGFHGELLENVASAISWCNAQSAFRIACDIPSGIDKNGIVQTLVNNEKIAFCAHETVTMGALKIALFSDEAKDFVGEVKVADLGISSKSFNSCALPDAFLIEESDIKLPIRIKKSVHKGNFGHSVVVLGEKAGAGIIAGTAALRFGSGLVTLLKTELFNENFLISPELMISNEMPEKTSAILIGSGLGRTENAQKVIQKIIEFAKKMQNVALVLDADFFYCKNLMSTLQTLNELKNARIILTPHPKELFELVNACKIKSDNNENVSLSSVIQNRFEYASCFAKIFPNLTLISKGANTYIFSGEKTFVCDCGSSALAKAGSGDVLAGLCVSLLSQNYSAQDASITAVFAHANASNKFNFNFECTPLSLIAQI